MFSSLLCLFGVNESAPLRSERASEARSASFREYSEISHERVPPLVDIKHQSLDSTVTISTTDPSPEYSPEYHRFWGNKPLRSLDMLYTNLNTSRLSSSTLVIYHGSQKEATASVVKVFFPPRPCCLGLAWKLRETKGPLHTARQKTLIYLYTYTYTIRFFLTIVILAYAMQRLSVHGIEFVFVIRWCMLNDAVCTPII